MQAKFFPLMDSFNHIPFGTTSTKLFLSPLMNLF